MSSAKSLLSLAIMVVSLLASLPALASGQAPAPLVSFGGRLLTDLGYHHLDAEQTANQRQTLTSAYASLAANSYLRATFTSPDRVAGGMVELGLNSKLGNAEAATLRYAYGWWRSGRFRLLAGQDESWLGGLTHAPKQFLGTSESGKLYLCQWGLLYSGRQPQARLEYHQESWAASLGLVQPLAELTPLQSGGVTTGSQALPATVDIHDHLPRLDLAFQFTLGGLWLGPGVGWVQHRLENAPGRDDNFTSWAAILPFKFTHGPLTLKGELHWAQNNDYEWSGNILSGLRGLPRSAIFLGPDGSISDTRQVGGFLAVEWKPTAQWEVTAGLGLERLTNDAWKDSAHYPQDSYTRRAVFLAIPRQVTPNFTIHPELGLYHYGDDVRTGRAFGDEWLAGVQFRWIF
ncbi:MAG: hypothetical protein LDL11_08710 [Desulfarculus sp.]|nr:hypothetical protein [Desulfarculus sp.]